MRTAPRDILPGRNEGEFRSWRPLPPTSAEGKDPSIILIEKRVLIRDCLTQCLRLSSEPNVIPFPSVEKWLEAADKTPAALIVFCIAGKSNDPQTHREIALLSQMEQHVPTVLLSDTEDLDHIVRITFAHIEYRRGEQDCRRTFNHHTGPFASVFFRQLERL